MFFAGLLVFIILTFVRPQDFVPALKGLPLIDFVLSFMCIGWFLHILITKKTKFIEMSQNILMLFFWFVIVLSTVRLLWVTYTFNTFIEWGKFILIYFLFINLIDSQVKLRVIIWTIVLCMAITAGIGIYQHFGIDLTGLGLRDDGRIRGVGIFDTNQLAYALSFGLPLIFCLFRTTCLFFIKLILTIFFCEFYYVIYLTDSRGGILCSIVVVGLLIIFFSKRKLAKVGAIVIGVAIFLFLSLASSRLNTLFDYHTDKSAQGRLNVWGEALMTLKSYPIFGLGKNQFRDNFSISPHNSYIQVVAELGLVGFFVWLALFYYCIKNLRRVNYYGSELVNKQQLVFSKCFQISLYAYLVGSFFSGNGYYITLYILFALAVVLQYLSNLKVFVTRPLFTFKDILNIFGMEVVVLLLLHWSNRF